MSGKCIMPYAVGVDIGGTTIRSALVGSNGKIRHESHIQSPVNSRGTADEILETFCSVISKNLQQANEERLTVTGIGIGMCGPQDYERGIPLLEGLDKYDALYGMNLKEELRRRFGLPESYPIWMEVDTWSFARGEAWMGAGKGYRRILALTLGTGFGSAFVVDGELLGAGPGIPSPLGWIGSLPFREGILDDVLSRRGILMLYTRLSNRDIPAGWDVHDIAEAARAGSVLCQQVFDSFGHLLGAAISPIINKFRAECLILGGRISRSFDLFQEGLICGLADEPTLQCIAVAKSIDCASLWGAAKMVFAHAEKKEKLAVST